MLDLDQHQSLGSALREALDRWPNETCLIESDRDRERTRLTYSDFKQLAHPLARALQDAEFGAGDRAAIIMTNQSKWLISAYAIFHAGGVLVPLDYKLTAGEHLQLLAHSKAAFLIVEFHLWRAMTQHADFKNHKIRIDNSPIGFVLDGSRLEDDVELDPENIDDRTIIFDVYLTMGIGLFCSMFNICMCYKWSGPARLEPEPPLGDVSKYQPPGSRDDDDQA